MSETKAASGRIPGDPAGRSGFLPGIMIFLRQVVGELKKVSTPSRKELVRYTIVVLVFVVVMIIIATVLDLAFGTGAAWLFGGTTGDD